MIYLLNIKSNITDYNDINLHDKTIYLDLIKECKNNKNIFVIIWCIIDIKLRIFKVRKIIKEIIISEDTGISSI